MIGDIEIIHWTKLHGLEIKQKLCLYMLSIEGFRVQMNCRLCGENHLNTPKELRIVVFDVSYVEKVLKDTILEPMGQSDLGFLSKLIEVAKRNLLDKEVERVRGEVVASSGRSTHT